MPPASGNHPGAGSDSPAVQVPIRLFSLGKNHHEPGYVRVIVPSQVPTFSPFKASSSNQKLVTALVSV